MKAANILETIGRTPHIRINRLFGNGRGVDQVRTQQPGRLDQGPDRPVDGRGRRAQRRLKPGGTIIEPTSGNTGIGLAMVAAVKGYKMILVMPDSMSVERRRLMLAYGAKFELTPREKGMKGSIARAEEMLADTPGGWIPQQFENPSNIEVHARTTAQEILEDFPRRHGRADHRRRHRRSHHRLRPGAQGRSGRSSRCSRWSRRPRR